MARLWSQDAKYEAWLKVELAVCEVYAKRGIVPAEALGRIKAAARVSASRIDEIEATTRHDLIAFLTNLEESIGADSRYVHIGMTSSDVVDTAQALQMVAASDLLLAGLERFREALRGLAVRHKGTLCVGRTHGIHAEPMVFGLKPALWFTEAGRNLERLRRAKEAIGVGKISGAVGTFAHILAIIAASLEKVASEIRSLQRTEILEAEEPFTEGQKGSSSMPHKRNPVSCEQVCGLARLVRTNSLAALEDVALWHERDISHSSVERVILPDSTLLVDYMLHQMTRIVEGLQVYPERMRENMERSFGLMFSQRVLLRLAETGLPRQQAYEIVQRNAMRAWRERTPFRAFLAADPEVTARLSAADLDACFDPTWYLRNVDTIYKRAGLS